MAELLLHADAFWLKTFWPITVATLCAWLAARMMTRPAAGRWLWRACVAKLFVVSLVPFSIALACLPVWDRSSAAERGDLAEEFDLPPETPRQDASNKPPEQNQKAIEDDRLTAFAAEKSPQPHVPFGLSSLCKVAWYVGFGVGVSGLAVQWIVVRRRLRRLPPLVDEQIRAAAREMAAAIGLRRIPPMLLDHDAASPQLVGLFRPWLIFPTWTLETSQSPSNLRLILAHEFAHAKCRDLCWSLLAAVATSVFFFHPLVWMARRRLLISQELAADDLTLRMTGVGVARYADLVLRIVERSEKKQPRHWLAMNAGLNLTELTERIEKMHSRTKSNSLVLPFAVLILVAGLIPWHADFIQQAVAADKDKTAAQPANPSKDALTEVPPPEFPYAIRFEQGATHFANGDRITIEQIRGTAETFTPGHIYWIRGTYTLASHRPRHFAGLGDCAQRDRRHADVEGPRGARDSLYDENPTGKVPGQATGAELQVQRMEVTRGSGTFRLFLPMSYWGLPHVSIYPVEKGDREGFGANYFGTGDSVLKHWWGTAGSKGSTAQRRDSKQSTVAAVPTTPTREPGATSKFPYPVRFEQGASKFLFPGDKITITEVRGTAATISPGNTYLIKGSYQLKSHQRATLEANTTAMNAADGFGTTQSVQSTVVENGSGNFTLILPMSCRGWPHISFYPDNGGSDFGGTYFGNGEFLLKHWWGEEREKVQGDSKSKGTSAKPLVPEDALSQRLWHSLGVRLSELPRGDENLRAVSDGTGGERNAHTYDGGLLVIDVRTNSPAIGGSLRKDDIVVGLHHWATVKMNDIAWIFAHAKDRLASSNKLRVHIVRHGTSTFTDLMLSDP